MAENTIDMAFTDDDLRNCKEWLGVVNQFIHEGKHYTIRGSDDAALFYIGGLISRLELKEALLDLVMERMRLINGTEEECAVTPPCPNHQLIRRYDDMMMVYSKPLTINHEN